MNAIDLLNRVVAARVYEDHTAHPIAKPKPLQRSPLSDPGYSREDKRADREMDED